MSAASIPLCEGVLVIGAAQGIGAAVARRMAAATPGARLVLADIRLEAVEALAAELRDRGVAAAAHQVDMGDAVSIERLVDQAGEVDRLALVAGIMHSHPSLEVTGEMFEPLFRINTVGTFLVAQAVARKLIARGKPGAICAVTSAGGHRPQPDIAPYCASKAAVTQALKVLALATTPHGIRINFVAPAVTQTAMMGDANPEDLARSIPIPIGRVNQPEDIANAVAFLLSDESQTMVMRELLIDGGALRGL